MQNTNVILQRWGRSLRRTSDREKVGLLAMPCTDPYEPDEDQDEEWRRLGLHAEIDRNKRQELYERFDLSCRLAECAVEPKNLVLGTLFSVVTGIRTPGGVSGNDEMDEGDEEEFAEGGGGNKKRRRVESMLKVMIAKRNEPPKAILLSDADVYFVQQLSKAIGRLLISPWRDNVDGLIAWRGLLGNEGKWPRAQIKRDNKVLVKKEMTEVERQEVKLGTFLSNQRQSRIAFLAKETNRKKLGGMTQARLDTLDAELGECWW